MLIDTLFYIAFGLAIVISGIPLVFMWVRHLDEFLQDRKKKQKCLDCRECAYRKYFCSKENFEIEDFTTQDALNIVNTLGKKLPEKIQKRLLIEEADIGRITSRILFLMNCSGLTQYHKTMRQAIVDGLREYIDRRYT